MTHYRPVPFLSPPQAEKDALLVDVRALPQGDRYFINLVIEEQTLQYYGTRRTLAKKLSAIGHNITPAELKDGRKLNLRCRVRTIHFGKLTVVQRLLPPKARPEDT